MKPKEDKVYHTIKEVGADDKYCLRCGTSVWGEVKFLESPPAPYQDSLLCENCLNEIIEDFMRKYPKTKRFARYRKLNAEAKKKLKIYKSITKFLDPKIDLVEEDYED